MFNRLARLWHHAIIGCNNQDHDIGSLRTTRTHGRKGFVTRSIEEGNHATRRFHMVSADVLGNATRLARRHFGLTDAVEQRSFTVIHVAHDGHHWCTRQELRIVRQDFFFGKCLRIVQRCHDGFVAQLFHQDHCCILIQRLVDGDHLTQLHQTHDDFG